MAAVSTIVAGIGLGLSAVSALEQRSAGKAAESNARAMAQSQREQAEQERRRADIQNTRSLRQSIRQSRVARATILNTGANVGTSGSSGVQGGAASVGSQSSANMGYFSALQDVNSNVTTIQGNQANLFAESGSIQADAAMAGAIGTLGNTIFSSAGGFKTIFDATQPKKTS